MVEALEYYYTKVLQENIKETDFRLEMKLHPVELLINRIVIEITDRGW